MEKLLKKYRFFYHYNKQRNKITIHFRNKCYIVDKLHCCVPCVSKWNKRQSRLVMEGKAEYVLINNNEGTIL
jgi:hypothetical protein